MRPLALLVLAESLVLVWLGVQWLGGGPVLAQHDPHPVPDATAPSATPVSATVAAAPAPAGSAAAARETPASTAADGGGVGIVVSGTVRNAADGGLVANASAALRREGDYRAGTGASPGTFAMAGLQPGEWKLTVQADGFAPHEAALTLDDRAFQTVDVELRPAHVVRVKLLDASGKPLRDALQQQTISGTPYVVATDAPLAGDLPPTAQSRLTRFGVAEWRAYDGSDGRDADPKSLAAGYAGELHLHRAPPMFASLLLRTTLLQGQRIEPAQQELVFTIDAKDVVAKHGTVRLRLLEANGAPIVGAVPTVDSAQGFGARGKTGTDGVAVIEHALPGLGVLEMHSPQRERLHRFVRVAPGTVTDLGDVVVGPAAKVTGTVVGADGKPANGALLRWTDLDARTFPQPLVDNVIANADAEGRFELWGCGRHRYVVFARSQDGAFGYVTVDARGGAPPPLVIELRPPATVTLRANVPPTEGYLVTALDAQRVPVAVATIASEYRPPSIALPRGSYTVEIHDLRDDRLVRSFALDVAGEPLTIDVP